MPELQQINLDLKGEIASLKKQNNDIIQVAQANGSLKKAFKLEVSKDVEGFIKAYVREQGFRNTKFASTPTEVTAYLKRVWSGIKDYNNLEEVLKKLTFAEFAQIYKPSCLERLSLCRQYVQSWTQEATLKWWLGHNQTLPTMEEMLGVWVIGKAVQEPEQPPNNASWPIKDKYKKDKEKYDAYMYKYELKLWYINHYLTAEAGSEFWGPKLKPYKIPTDRYKDGETLKMHVPAAAEAFGLVQFENSHDRWLACFSWKKQNPGKGKKPPTWSKKRDEETKAYKCLWSDHSHGQGSGWAPVAYTTYNTRLAAVMEFRKQEGENDYHHMGEGRDMIKVPYNISLEQTEPSKNKKRKREVVVEALDDDSEATMKVNEIQVEEE